MYHFPVGNNRERLITAFLDLKFVFFLFCPYLQRFYDVFYQVRYIKFFCSQNKTRILQISYHLQILNYLSHSFYIFTGLFCKLQIYFFIIYTPFYQGFKIALNIK